MLLEDGATYGCFILFQYWGLGACCMGVFDVLIPSYRLSLTSQLSLKPMFSRQQLASA